MRTSAAPSLLLAAAALAACAHAPAPAAPAPATAPAWPAPPAAARVRWVTSVPADDRPAAAPPSWWRRTLDVVIGIEAEPGPGRMLERPFGLAVDGDRLLVADPDGAQVLIIDWRKGTSEPLECAARAWGMPMAVAIAPDRTRYVSDAAGAIARLPLAGGCTLIGEGRLQRPTGVAWLDGRVWAVDPPAHGLVAFTPEGQEVLRLGTLGAGDGQLHFPTALAAAADGTLLVVDALNFRVVRYAADGRFLGQFGRAGEEEGAFGRPKAVAAGPGGAVLVTDAASDQVKLFSAEGSFQLAFGGSGTGPGQLLLPAGLAVAGGRIFVASSLSHRIEVYELVGEA